MNMLDPSRTSVNSSSRSGLSQDDPRLVQAIEVYLAALDAGRPLPREEFLAQYAQIESQLAECLDGLEFVRDAARNVRLTSALEAPLADQPDIGGGGTLGDFRILRELGRGGMGIVYEAEQVSLRRRVAVKVLPLAALLKETQLQRFHNEARAAAMLKHPHIVSVHFVGCDRGVHYYAMELIRGQSLAELIKDEGGRMKDEGKKVEDDSATIHSSAVRPHRSDTSPIAAITTQPVTDRKRCYRTVATLGVQAAEALYYAHQHGVIHRDVKPSNLLLDTDGKLHVTDFGLARIQAGEDVTLSGDLLGTLRYASPEQLSGEQVVDERTDIYSLGLTLYELLAMQPAFSGREREQIVRQVLDWEPAPLRRLDPKIPVDLETIIARAAAKERDLRYRTAQELADDLQRFLEQRPIRARRIGRLGRTWRWCRRSPSFAGLVAAVFFLLICMTAGTMVFALRESAHRQAADARATEAEWQLYLSDVHSAMAAWEDSNVGRTLELLERHRPKPGQPDHRGFEWHYLQRQLHDDRRLITIQDDSLVWDSAFSHDGRLLATGNGRGIAKLWDAATGQLIHEFDGNHVIANRVAFSPDDTILAVADKAGNTDLWDLDSRTTLRVLKVPHNEVKNIVFSSDGAQLATGLDQSLRIWDVTTGNELREIQPRVHERLSSWRPYAPWNRPRLWAAGDDGTLRLFDTDTGAELRSIRRDELTMLRMGTCAVSSDGKVAATGGQDGVVRLVDLEAGSEVASLGANLPAVRALAFHPGAQRLATSDNHGKVVIWDLDQRQPLTELKGHSGPVWRITFSFDGRRMATCGTDQTVIIWDVARPIAITDVCRGHTGLGLCLAFSPDGRTVASGAAEAEGGLVKLWDVASGQLLKTLPGHTDWVWSVAFSPDGSELASTGDRGDIRLWDVARGVERLSIHAGDVDLVWVEFSRNGREVIGREEHGKFRVWDRATGTPLRMVQLDKERVWKPVLSHDGRWIAAAVESGVVLLDYASLKIVRRIPSSTGGMWEAAFSRDDQFLAWSSAKRVQVVSLAKDETVVTFDHPFDVRGVDFSPDGRTLVTCDDGNNVHLWDIAHGSRRATLRGHDHWVMMVRFSPDGQTIASVSNDGTIRLWRGPPQKP